MGRKKKGRANGEGSVYEYPKGSGIWHAQITIGWRVKRKRAKSQRQAREKLQILQSERDHGIKLTVAQLTVGDWCKMWLDVHATHLKLNIREEYERIIKRYILSAPLSKRRLADLTATEVQRWVNDLTKHRSKRTGEYLAAQTVRNAYARLNKALSVATKHKYISENVAASVELPSVQREKIRPLTFEQTKRLLNEVRDHRWAALCHLAVNLGLRAAELLGLTWDDINLETRELQVHRQLKRIQTNDQVKAFVLHTTKTQSSSRTLILSDDILKLLQEHRANQDAERHSSSEWKDTMNLVFVSQTGAPIHYSCLRAHFKRLLSQADLPDIRFHELRHTAATLMLADNVPLVTVSKILGHSSPSITATIYAHALDTSIAKAIAGLSDRLTK
ncbi:MAG: site-specific integrase [Chloroflexota bacterium]